MRSALLLLALAVGLTAVGCTRPAAPRAETAADSLAVRIADASGGLDAFAALPVLRFDWAVVRDSAEVTRRRHLWDRAGDRYRLEWTGGEDSVYVALFAPAAFDTTAAAGQASLNGTALAGDALADALADAYETYVNDTYWLLAPLKLMDPGAVRALAPDSGAAVLELSFENVGITPGDRYWIQTDPTTGAMTGWSFRLEGDTTTGRWAWTDPATVATPRGPLSLATVKTNLDRPVRILTEPLSAPDDATLWTDLAPRLTPAATGEAATGGGTR